MYPTYVDFLFEPAEQEFFIRFAGIYSRDPDGDAVNVRLISLGSDPREVEYCDKILVGETLETSVKRALFDTFGLDVVDYSLSVFACDVVKKTQDTPVTRFTIVAFVTYAKLKDDLVDGCKTAWSKREDAISWLKKTNVPVLGKNSSVKTEHALSFVLDLYNAGALDIQIYEENREDDESSNDQIHPDYLEILLPKNKKERSTILNIINTGIPGHIQDMTKVLDTDQTTIQYYWN